MLVCAVAAAAQTTVAGTNGPSNQEPQKPGEPAKPQADAPRTLSLGSAFGGSSDVRRTFTVTTSGQWNCCSPAGETRQPWAIQPKGPESIGASARVGTANTFLSLGMVGSRDTRYPMFMTTTLAGSEIPTPALSSMTDISKGRRTWQVVGSAKKQLFTSKGGKTVGVSGDVFIPLGAEAPSDVPHNPIIAGKAARFGIVFGF